MKYELSKEHKAFLKGYKYQMTHIQDGLLKVDIDPERGFASVDIWSNILWDNVTVYANGDTLRLVAYCDGVRK